MKSDVALDVEAVSRIDAVSTVLNVIAETTELRVALLARVTHDSWTACAILDRAGFGRKAGDQLAVATTLCSEIWATREPLVISDARTDARFCRHATPGMYNVHSYIGVPITGPDGRYFGNLCAFDSRPKDLSPARFLAMMQLFAELLGRLLRDEAAHAENRAALRDAQATAELREHFMAILGHDLRNPLSAISLDAQTLARAPLAEPERRVVARIRASAGRMASLVSGLLDFTRGRLGGGIPLVLAEVSDLEAVLRGVIHELEAQYPDRPIRFLADRCGAVRCDRDRVAQVLSNLLANALEHGPRGGPVDVLLRGTATTVVLAVRNGGPPIPAAALPRLFQPYQRGDGARPRAGLGLGLYIVDQIARAHAGTIEVTSTAEEGTCFTFTLPRRLLPIE